MSDVLEQVFAFGLAGASIIISLLDFAGLLQGIPFLAGRTSALSLLVIGSAVGYLALERRSKLDKIEEVVIQRFEKIEEVVTQRFDKTDEVVTQGFDRTLSSMTGGRVKLFEDVTDMWEYVARRTKEARRCVDDLTWGDHLSKRRTPAQEDAFQQYLSAKSFITTGTPVEYREVMTFPSTNRLERAESLAGNEHFGYQLRYFDINHTLLPPLIQFTVIDSEELIFTFHRGRYIPNEPEIHMATRQKEMVHLFQDYFNAIWDRARVIKAAGQPADPQVLQHIRQQYRETSIPDKRSSKK